MTSATATPTGHRPVALVTGASRGIGRAIALDLIRTHDVVVGGTQAASVDECVQELSEHGIGRAISFVADLTDEAALHSAVRELDLAQLDVLVHSAGTAEYGTIAETGLSSWQRMFEINLFAVAELTRLLLPALRAANGQVVVLNSGAGFNAGPGAGAYAASKFALRALTDALRAEERGKVRVCSIHPGRVDTDMQRDLQSWLGNTDYQAEKHIRPETIAATVRTAVDTSPEALIEELVVRPVVP